MRENSYRVMFEIEMTVEIRTVNQINSLNRSTHSKYKI